jgi:hypothetical protein
MSSRSARVVIGPVFGQLPAGTRQRLARGSSANAGAVCLEQPACLYAGPLHRELLV